MTTRIHQNGRPFRLSHSTYFHTSSASFCFASGNEVVFKDHRGNYARVVNVRNAPAWCKRHGYPAE